MYVSGIIKFCYLMRAANRICNVVEIYLLVGVSEQEALDSN